MTEQGTADAVQGPQRPAADGIRIVRYGLPPVSPEALDFITLGVRTKKNTQSTGNRMRKHDAAKLRDAWDSLNQFERFLLIILAEQKCMVAPQVKGFFSLQSKGVALGVPSSCETWMHLLSEKYGTELSAEKIFTAKSPDTAYNKADAMRRNGLIAGVKHVSNNLLVDKDKAPSLMSVQYFLTEYGTQVLSVGSGIPVAQIKGYMPNHENAAFSSMLHLAEANDLFLSVINAAQDLMNRDLASVGVIDVNRWTHEMNTNHKFDRGNGPVMFKSDGYMILYSSMKGGFLDFYLEHDTSSTTPAKMIHKTSAFIDWVMHNRLSQDEAGVPFRRPLLLFVSPSEAKVKSYRENISLAANRDFPGQVDYINSFARIAISTAAQIKEHSPLGDVWQVVDPRTGGISKERFNLLTVGW